MTRTLRNRRRILKAVGFADLPEVAADSVPDYAGPSGGDPMDTPLKRESAEKPSADAEGASDS